MARKKGDRANYWTIDEVETLKNFFFEGKEYHEISKIIGRSYTSITQKSRKMGFTKRSLWTPDEIEALKKLISEGKTGFEISKIIARSHGSVIGMSNKLKLVNPKFWTKEEIETLKKLVAEKKGFHEISEILGRGYQTVKKRSSILGLNNSPCWIPRDDEILKKLRSEGKSYPEISKIIGKSVSAVSQRYRNLGFSPKRGLYFQWTPDKVEILKKHLSEGKSYDEVSKIMGTSRESVASRAPDLGLKSTYESIGEKSGRWLGDTVDYRGLHVWVRYHLPQPKNCELCGKTEQWLDLSNVSGEYKRNLKDWMYLCKKCHKNFDKQRNLRKTDFGLKLRFNNPGRKEGKWLGSPPYQRIHKWVKKNKPSPKSCELCGKTQQWLDCCNISGEYKKDLDDWTYLCRSCHEWIDMWNGRGYAGEQEIWSQAAKESHVK